MFALPIDVTIPPGAANAVQLAFSVPIDRDMVVTQVSSQSPSVLTFAETAVRQELNGVITYKAHAGVLRKFGRSNDLPAQPVTDGIVFDAGADVYFESIDNDYLGTAESVVFHGYYATKGDACRGLVDSSRIFTYDTSELEGNPSGFVIGVPGVFLSMYTVPIGKWLVLTSVSSSSSAGDIWKRDGGEESVVWASQLATQQASDFRPGLAFPPGSEFGFQHGSNGALFTGYFIDE